MATVSFPELINIDNDCFLNCASLTNISLPSCINLGLSVGFDRVFGGSITGNIIDLTVNPALLTCNSGTPDGDIIDLYINNTVTVNGSPLSISGFTGNLTLEFDNIANADLLVGDSSDVADWNVFFNLPDFSTSFTSVNVVGNSVELIGGENIVFNQLLFNNNIHIISAIDTGCVFYLGNVCFQGCTSLTSVNLSEVISTSNYCFNACSSLITASLPSLTTIGDGCFYYCTSLVTVNSPLVTYISQDCFNNCTSLTTISFSLVTFLGDYCFYGCTGLTTISLPSLITAGDSCFGNCTSLVSLNFSGLTSAGHGCFFNCTSLINPDFTSLTSVGSSCFYNCTGFTTMSFPVLTTAGTNCFWGCTSLITLSIPSCTALGATTANNNVFFSIIGNTITLTVPSALMTCNVGNPDGDIVYLQANNTVTVITI